MSQQVLPEVYDGQTGYGGGFVTIIYNNERNTFEEVVRVIVYATGCTMEEAYIETWEAHHYGKSLIHFSSQEACAAVATIVSSIGVKTEVRPEWDD